MDPIQAEIYSTVLTSAPYIIGAYVLVWLILLSYVVVSNRSLKKTEQHLAALEEALESIEAKQQP